MRDFNETDFLGKFTSPTDPNPYPDRFKDPQFITSEKDPKKGLVLSAERAIIMIDFGRSIQTLGLTLTDAKALAMGLVEAVAVGMLQERDKSPTH